MKTRKKGVKVERTTNYSWFFFYIDWEQRELWTLTIWDKKFNEVLINILLLYGL